MAITPEQASAELARRASITPEQASAELSRRDLSQLEAPEGVQFGAEARKPSPALQRATAVTQGLTLGFADELQGLLEGVSEAATGGDFAAGQQAGELAGREAFQTAQEDRPLETLALTLAGGLPTGGLGGARAAQAVAGRGAGRLGQAAAAGAPVGAAAGVGFADAKTVGEAALGAGLGAVGGAVAAPIAGAIGGGIRAIGGRFATEPVKRATSLLGDIEEGVTDVTRVQQIQEVLGKEAKTLNTRIGKAFDTAKDKTAFITKDSANKFVTQLRDKAIDTIDDDQKVLFENAATRIEGLATKGNVSVNDLQGLRRAATKASTSGGAKAQAAGNIKGSIDELLDDSIQAGEVLGDKTAVAAWKKAIGLRREYGQRFEASRAVKSAIEEGSTPETVAQQIFGSGSIGNARAAAKTFDEVVKASTNKKETTELLKQSIVNKIFRTASRGTEDAGDDLIWIRKLANEIKSLRRDNVSLFNKFSTTERKQLNDLEKNLRKAQDTGILNKVAEFTLRTINRSPVAKVQLPTTLAPQQQMSAKDIIRLSNTNPRDVDEFLATRLGVTGEAAGLAAGEITQDIQQ